MNLGKVIEILIKNVKWKKVIEKIMSNTLIKIFIERIFSQIQRYPYVKKHPFIFFINFTEIMYAAIITNLSCVPNIINEFDSTLKDNKDITTDYFIDFVDSVREKYNLDVIIIEEENVSKYIFVNGENVLFNKDKNIVTFLDSSFIKLKDLAEKYDASIIVTSQISGKKFKEIILNEFEKHEIYNVNFAKTKGFIDHKNIIKQQIKTLSIGQDNYVIFNRRKDLGKTLKNKLVTCKDGINNNDIESASSILS